VSYTDNEARQGLLEAIAPAVDEIGAALAALGEAYEQLDEVNGDALEEQLFGPVQKAYGRAKRTYGDFATRHGLEPRDFEPAVRAAPSNGVKGFVDLAKEDLIRADAALITLQDSMLPVEVGDAELRSGLAEVRTLLSPINARARHFVSRLGR
jgi:hypothetical protein